MGYNATIRLHILSAPLHKHTPVVAVVSALKGYVAVGTQAAPLKNVNRRSFAASFVFDPSFLMRLIGAVC